MYFLVYMNTCYCLDNILVKLNTFVVKIKLSPYVCKQTSRSKFISE